MTASLTILRAAPLTTLQDDGRFGMLRHGISASGPMDRAAFRAAGALAGSGRGGIEHTTAGLDFMVTRGNCHVGYAGGDFVVRHNGVASPWPGELRLREGDRLTITPGRYGNYGYVRFNADIVAPLLMGSMSTSSRSRLGGLDGGVLDADDVVELAGGGQKAPFPARFATPETGPIRVVWGLHADLFPAELRQRFPDGSFTISTRLDRMGVRLDDREKVFADAAILSLVSDAIMPGDIQILGDSTPIVLMRDHQPTGGYPRIATVITADLDRFAQLRPGTAVAFQPVSVEHAQALLRSRGT